MSKNSHFQDGNDVGIFRFSCLLSRRTSIRRRTADRAICERQMVAQVVDSHQPPYHRSGTTDCCLPWKLGRKWSGVPTTLSRSSQRVPPQAWNGHLLRWCHTLTWEVLGLGYNSHHKLQKQFVPRITPVISKCTSLVLDMSRKNHRFRFHKAPCSIQSVFRFARRRLSVCILCHSTLIGSTSSPE